MLRQHDLAAISVLAAFALGACSLQDFDRLSQGQLSPAGSGGSSTTSQGGSTDEGGAGGSNGGSSTTTQGGSGGSNQQGGSSGSASGGADSNGGASGNPSTGGSGGSDPASGGSSGEQTGGTGPVQTQPNLLNPSFEFGTSGWLFEPPSAQDTLAYAQWPTLGSTTPDGQNELSTWSESEPFTVRVYQELSGLDDGTYAFTGHFVFGTGHNEVSIFAEDCGGTDQHENVPQTQPTEWIEFSLTDIEVVGGSCVVGFFVDANPGNWLNADLFSFELDTP